MKKHFYFFIFAFLLLVSEFSIAQNVGIGTNNPKATLDVTSTTNGFLPPRMTYAQRNAIVNPEVGLIIYCTDCANGEMQYYSGNAWMKITVALGSVPFVVPTVTTTSIRSITASSAYSGGNITTDGGTPVTVRGVVWDTLPLPTIALSTKTTNGSGAGVFSSSLTGLQLGKTYHVRAYATNIVGTAYGGDSSFSHPTLQLYSYTAGPDVTDANGNIYPSILTSCGQTWTTKNLNVSIYRNGDTIPQVTNGAQWSSLTTGAWCWYNNDSANYWQYGKLYNWYAVNDPRGLAPLGWHVPSYAEWNKLAKCIDPNADTTTIGDISSVGGAMKETGTSHWSTPNTGATNSSGFAGLPGGYRLVNGSNGYFLNVGYNGDWWSSTEYNTISAYYFETGYSFNSLYKAKYGKTYGSSVRLVRD